MILEIVVKPLLPTERGMPATKVANLRVPGWNPGLFSPLLLKDNSSSVGLRNQKLLVQIQVAAMPPTPLSITTSFLLIFGLLASPLLTRLFRGADTAHDLAGHIKTAVMLGFLLSLAPLCLYLFLAPEFSVTS